MKKTMTFHRKKIWMVFLVCALMLLGLVGRLVYLMGVRSQRQMREAVAIKANIDHLLGITDERENKAQER